MKSIQLYDTTLRDGTQMEEISLSVADKIAKVSIVGMAMRSHSGVATKVFETLAGEGINILGISTSEIKISCLIEEKYTELAVRVLHSAFGLGKPANA